MASVRQIEANRRNASGPHQMTKAGKEAVRVNAIRHGLASRLHVVLPGEDLNFYEELRDSLLSDYAPATIQEELLVNQIAENFRRLLRARSMESGSFSSGLLNLIRDFDLPEAPKDEMVRGSYLAMAYTKNDKVFAKLGRYETTIERSYYRAVRELTKIQSTRIRSVSQSAAPAPEIRSVPQSAENPDTSAAPLTPSVPIQQQPASAPPAASGLQTSPSSPRQSPYDRTTERSSLVS